MKLSKTIDHYVCDICGEHADGRYSAMEYLNGELHSELTCPLDLCVKHMETWAVFMSHTAIDRYEPKLTESAIGEMLMMLNDYIKGEVEP